MFGRRNGATPHPALAAKTEPAPRNGHEPAAASTTLLTIVGQKSRVEGKFEIADSIQIECEVGGELTVGGKLVIGEHGLVTAVVRTVDAVIKGRYDGNMVATGNVEVTATQGGFFNGNVAKIREHDAMSGPRPVHLLEDKRVGAQK